MKSEIKTALILGVVIMIGLAVTSIALSTLDKSETAITQDVNSNVKIDKSDFKPAPDLVGIVHYLNTTPEELKKQIKDKVVLYDIWTYSCINCVRTLPYITAWMIDTGNKDC